MVEMLVAVSIILVLIGLSVAGFAQIGKHSKAQHTKVALEAVRAMTTEFQTSGGTRNYASFKAAWDNGGFPLQVTKNAGGFDQITYGAPPNTEQWEIYSARVLEVLLQLPNNRAIYEKLPADQVRTVPDPNGGLLREILDGYGNPIRFVPSGGVQGQAKNQPAEGMITDASAVRPLLLQSDGTLHDPSKPKDRAPAPTFFWMSMGPDKNALTHDDNHYSTAP
jgi:type II secretory pathway pseudopilin PulG